MQIHKGTEFNNVKETWEENEKRDKPASGQSHTSGGEGKEKLEDTSGLLSPAGGRAGEATEDDRQVGSE